VDHATQITILKKKTLTGEEICEPQRIETSRE